MKTFSLCVRSVTGLIYSIVIASQNWANGNKTYDSTPDAFAIQISKMYTSEFQFIGFNPEIHRQANFPLISVMKN